MTDPFLDPRVRGVFDRAFSPAVQQQWPDYTRFTPWLHIDSTKHPIRSGAKANTIGTFQGVYLAAVFLDGPPGGAANPFDANVVYIGRTRTANLTKRWGQFRAAIRGDGGHSGGNTFYKKLVQPTTHPQRVRQATFLAGLPVWLGDADGRFSAERTSFRTALLEAVLVEAVYAHKAIHGGRKLLNKK